MLRSSYLQALILFLWRKKLSATNLFTQSQGVLPLSLLLLSKHIQYLGHCLATTLCLQTPHSVYQQPVLLHTKLQWFESKYLPIFLFKLALACTLSEFTLISLTPCCHWDRPVFLRGLPLALWIQMESQSLLSTRCCAHARPPFASSLPVQPLTQSRSFQT